MEDNETGQAPEISICEMLGITMTFIHVPYSVAKVRDKFGVHDNDYPRLCYDVTVYKNGNYVLNTSYFTGADIPDWLHSHYHGKDPNKYLRARAQRIICEHGICPKRVPHDQWQFFTAIEQNPLAALKRHKSVPIFPKPDDVMRCLVSDAQGIYCSRTFEEWAGDYGCDTDSRRAECIYNACKDTFVSLARHFDLEQLFKLFEDY